MHTKLNDRVANSRSHCAIDTIQKAEYLWLMEDLNDNFCNFQELTTIAELDSATTYVAPT